MSVMFPIIWHAGSHGLTSLSSCRTWPTQTSRRACVSPVVGSIIRYPRRRDGGGLDQGAILSSASRVVPGHTARPRGMRRYATCCGRRGRALPRFFRSASRSSRSVAWRLKLDHRGPGERRSMRERCVGVVVVQLNPVWLRPSVSGRGPTRFLYLSARQDPRTAAALPFDVSTQVVRRIPLRFVRAGAAPCFARAGASTSGAEPSVAPLADTNARSMRPRGVSGHVVADEHRAKTLNWCA